MKRAAQGLALLLVVLMAVAFSPLTDGDTGWRNTVGDVVWTGMFLVFAALVFLGLAALVGKVRQTV